MSTDVTNSVIVSPRVAAEIRAEMGRQQITGRELARRLGRSANWVSLKVGGTQRIDVDEMALIAEALGVTIVDLLPRSLRGVTETFAPTSPVSPGPRRLVPRQRDDSVRPTSGRPPNRPSIVARPDRYLRTAPTG